MFDLTWFLVAASLIGNACINKQNIAGHWVWLFANAGWVYYDLLIGVHSQAALFGVYMLMNLWGIFEWKYKARIQRYIEDKRILEREDFIKRKFSETQDIGDRKVEELRRRHEWTKKNRQTRSTKN